MWRETAFSNLFNLLYILLFYSFLGLTDRERKTKTISMEIFVLS